MVISVQLLRALAALTVVVHHAAWKGAQYSDDPLSWFHIGNTGVDLFFIISGYIMCHTTYERRGLSFASFMRARAIRILPLYWFLTSVALIVYLLWPEKVNSSGGETSILHSYTLFPVQDKYLIRNGWTLSYEFYFYMLFGTGLVFMGFLRALIPAFIIVGLVGYGVLYSEGTSFQLIFLTNPLLAEFLLGMGAFFFFKCFSMNRITSVFLIAASLGWFVYVNNVLHGASYRLVDYGLPSFLLFMGLFGFENYFQRHREHKAVSFIKGLGDSSYSLYLIHPFVLVVTSILSSKVGLTDYSVSFVVVLVLSSLIVGHGCFLFVERKLNDGAKRLILNRRQLSTKINSVEAP